MRILFLAAGNSIHTKRWVEELSKKGNEVHLCYCNNHEPKDIDRNIICHRLKYKAPLGYFLNAHELNKIFYEVCPDIVNAHYASGYGTLLRRSKIKPNVLNVWGSDVYEFPHKNIFNYHILCKNIKYADAIASTSNDMAVKLRKVVHNPNLSIKLTPFGVNIGEYAIKSYSNASSDNITIGIVKSLERIYGINYLIDAFSIVYKKLKEENPNINVSLEIYGKGSIEEELKLQAENLGIYKYVKFRGYIENDNVPEVLSKMDIFVVPSLQESFGVAAVEAMAAGLPVIASDVGGLREVVKKNFTGILVKPKDVDALVDALNLLIKDYKLREYYGKNGRETVEEHFNFSYNVDSMVEFYNIVKNRSVR